MTYEAGFTPGVLVKVHVNRLCGEAAEREDTIATDEQCLFWNGDGSCPTASPTTAPTTARPTFKPTTVSPTTKKPTKSPSKKPTKTPK